MAVILVVATVFLGIYGLDNLDNGHTVVGTWQIIGTVLIGIAAWLLNMLEDYLYDKGRALRMTAKAALKTQYDKDGETIPDHTSSDAVPPQDS